MPIAMFISVVVCTIITETVTSLYFMSEVVQLEENRITAVFQSSAVQAAAQSPTEMSLTSSVYKCLVIGLL